MTLIHPEFVGCDGDGGGGGGGGTLVIRTLAATGPILTTDDVVLLDGTAGSFVASLPTAIGNSGLNLYVKRIDSTPSNTVTLAGVLGQTIDGGTVLFKRADGSVEIVSDGTGWHIIG